jgi:flagellar L-ring protein precursor FlgH
MRAGQGLAVAVLLTLIAATPLAAAKPTKKSKNDPSQLRADYINRIQEHDAQAGSGRTVGSLWLAGGSVLGDLSVDYKAQKLNDTIVILASVQTTAAQSGDSSYKRTFQTASGITGLAGDIKTTGLNPLFNANSSTQLQGSGATDSSTAFQTSLTGRVIAVLPSGNLRGVARPGDIGPNNTITSAALSNLEIEMKGKGIIADSTRPLNPITKALLWLVGF